MIRIIEKPFEIPFTTLFDENNEQYEPKVILLNELFKCDEINDDMMYSRTSVGIGDNVTHDLNLRSSWTHKLNFSFSSYSNELHEFNKYNNIDLFQNDNYKLIKYETGDFFKKHIDTQLNGFHKYTCLIFCPNDEPFDGGNIIFTNKNETFTASFDISKFTEITMIIFSLDLYHEIKNVISGKRFVFKKPLFTNHNNEYISYTNALSDVGPSKKITENEIYELCDGGLSEMLNGYKTGDY